VNRTAPPQTILDAFERIVVSHGGAVAARIHEESAWVGRRWEDIDREVKSIALGLIERGVRHGDRIAIMAPSSLRWFEAELAIFRAGGVLVPIYPTSGLADVEHVLTDSGTVAVFVADASQRARVASIRARIPKLAHVFVMDNDAEDDALDGVIAFDTLRSDLPLSTASARALLREAPSQTRGDSLAMLMYTSGTTGRPKGVMITHENVLASANGLLAAGFVTDDDEAIFFLPLAHCFAQMQACMWLLRGNPVIFARSIEKVVDDMGETNPTCFAGVPRLFEKVYNKVVGDGSAATGLKGFLFRKTIRALEGWAAARALGETFFSLWLLIGRVLVLPKVRQKLLARMGGRIRWMASGGAPLAPPVMALFEACGFAIYEGYGLTECMACATVNAGANRPLGSVGTPIEGCEVRLADDGEVLIRGAGVMVGYWNQPEATGAALDADGWLHSGDIGRIGDDGRLRITDRKKDIIITAGGKNVAPQNAENTLKTCPLVSQVVVYGDRRPYLTAIVTVNEENARAALRQRGRDESALSYVELSKAPVVRAIIQEAFDRFNAGAGRFETIKRFVVLDHDLTLEGGDLTATLKLRRAAVVSRYAHVFDAMYQVETVHRRSFTILATHSLTPSHTPLR